MLERIGAQPIALQETQQAAQVAQGSKGGSKGAVRLASPSQLLADMAEEISFSHSERLEKKNIEEYDCEDYLDRLHTKLIEEVEEVYPLEDVQHQEKFKSFREHLAQNPDSDEEGIREFLGQCTGDSGEALALIARALKDDALPGGEAMRQKLEHLAHRLTEEEAPQIQASINVMATARNAHAEGAIAVEKLQTSYQSMVEDYSAILPALAQLAESDGVKGFEDGARFLTRAAAADLAAARPSVAPARLQRILAEFQGVKIFNTLGEWVDGSLKRFAKILPKTEAFKRDAFFSRLLAFLVGPERFQTLVARPIATLSPSDKVLMLQDMRQGVRNLPNWLFGAGKEAKARILYPVQKEIDHLVFEEEA